MTARLHHERAFSAFRSRQKSRETAMMPCGSLSTACRCGYIGYISYIGYIGGYIA